jgi:DNA-binding CsgD family transcriptional regulator
MANSGQTMLDFISLMDSLNDAGSVWRAFRGFVAERGFPFAALADVTGPRTRPLVPLLDVAWPAEWEERYRLRSYVLDDPNFLYLKRTAEPFTWEEAVEACENTPRQRRVMDEASEFGMRCGFVVPIYSLKMAPAVITMAGLRSFQGEHARAELHLAAIYAHSRIRALSPPESEQAAPVLTARERECLEWVAAGKSDWEIGEILAISEKTVNAHVERVKRKFAVGSRIQAVVMALRARRIEV